MQDHIIFNARAFHQSEVKRSVRAKKKKVDASRTVTV